MLFRKTRPRSPVPPPRYELSWVSPFALSDSSAWHDGQWKPYWIGPFDLNSDHFARAASENMSPEAPELQQLRRLADVQYTEGDHIGARFSLAQIVEKYVSDLEHTPKWTEDYEENRKKRDV